MTCSPLHLGLWFPVTGYLKGPLCRCHAVNVQTNTSVQPAEAKETRFLITKCNWPKKKIIQHKEFRWVQDDVHRMTGTWWHWRQRVGVLSSQKSDRLQLLLLGDVMPTHRIQLISHSLSKRVLKHTVAWCTCSLIPLSYIQAPLLFFFFF